MRIEEESPLRFLDGDVSRLIYETYFPNKKTIQLKDVDPMIFAGTQFRTAWERNPLEHILDTRSHS